MTRALLVGSVSALLACGTSTVDRATVRQTMVGDTVVLAIEAPPGVSPSVTIDSVTPVWTPEEFRAIRGLAIGKRILAATDGRGVLGFDREGGTAFPVGVSGEGPGEYRRVAAVVIGSRDQITVADPMQARVLQFDSAGRALPEAARALGMQSSWSVRAVAPGLAESMTELVAWDHGLISVDGLEDSLRVAAVVAADSAETLFMVPEGLWATIDGVPAKRDAYGVRALVGLDPRDGAAVSTGVDYVIRWWRPGATPQMLRIERGWRRAVAGGELEPPPGLLEGLGPTGEMLTKVANGQERGDLKNAVEQLVLVGQGRLLVKVVDSTARYHPYYLGRLPELRPSHWTWEVLDHEGSLRGQLRLPSAFTPSRVVGCELWGVLEQPDGTQAVARVGLAGACGWF